MTVRLLRNKLPMCQGSLIIHLQTALGLRQMGDGHYNHTLNMCCINLRCSRNHRSQPADGRFVKLME